MESTVSGKELLTRQAYDRQISCYVFIGRNYFLLPVINTVSSIIFVFIYPNPAFFIQAIISRGV